MNLIKYGLITICSLLPLVSVAIDLREGDVYQGEVLIGKYPGKSCFLTVDKDVSTNSDHHYSITFRDSASESRHFKARPYDGYLTAKTSVYQKKTTTGNIVRKKNSRESLHINFLKTQSLDSALILDDEKIVSNCVGLRLVR